MNVSSVFINIILLQCSRTESLDVFFNEVQASSVPRIAIIGSGYSTAEPVAEISHYWNISQVVFVFAHVHTVEPDPFQLVAVPNVSLY